MRTTLTINQVIDEWLDNCDVQSITRYYYRRKLMPWFNWLNVQGKNPRTPSRADVIAYKRSLEDRGHTQLTVNGYVTTIKLFYRFLEERRYYENIAAGIRSSSAYRGYRKKPLRKEEAETLIESLGNKTEIEKRDRLMIVLMLLYGLRTCEVQRINISDFDVEGNHYLLRIQRKGRRSKVERIAVSRTIIEMMEDYIACRNFQPTDPLFVVHAHRAHGQRISRNTISQTVKVHLRRIGIDRKEITAHSLRHTCACMLIGQGVSIEDVRAVLGHTDINTTRIYTGFAQDEKMIEHNPSYIIEDMLLKHPKRPGKENDPMCIDNSNNILRGERQQGKKGEKRPENR